MDWERGCYRVVSQVTGFDPFRFFLWEYIKNLVYQTKEQDMDELHRRIPAACETVTPVMLQNAWSEVEYYHLDICRATKGALAEFY
jgi:hypothetical protein